MKKKWSLSLVFTLPFILQIFATVSIIGVLTYRTGKESALEFAKDLRQETTETIQLKIAHHLSGAHLLSELNIDAVERGDLSFDLTQFNPQNDRYLWHMIQRFPGVAWISMGSEDQGDYLGIVKEGNKPLRIVVTNDTTQRYTYSYALDENGQRLPNQLDITRYTYDSRQRPWYQCVVQAGKPTWSDLFQTPSQSAQETIFLAMVIRFINRKSFWEFCL